MRVSYVLATMICATASCLCQSTKYLRSIYTDLSGPQCKLVREVQETGASIRSCPGVDSYHLLVLEDDNRASITITDARNREFPLNFWDTVTHAVSTLGEKAEWRVLQEPAKAEPVALITI